MMLLENGKHPVLGYRGLAWKIANKYKGRLPPTVSVEDLHSHMMLTLTKCSAWYDPNGGAKYATYAYKSMVSEARSFVQKSWDCIKIKHRNDRVNGLTRDKYLMNSADVKLGNYGHINSDDYRIIDHIEGPSAVNGPVNMLDSDDWDAVLSVMENDKQKRVVTSFYRDGKKMADVIKEMGLTKQRIIQIRIRAIELIKSSVDSGKLEFLRYIEPKQEMHNWLF